MRYARGRRAATALALALALVAGGCGGTEASGGSSNRLVDANAGGEDEPPVNAFTIDPDDGSFLVTTNRGFFRIAPDGDDVERIRGTVRDPAGSSPVGSFLEVEVDPAGGLIGSGHPDAAQPLPQYLGFLRSDDGGRTWDIVSLRGEADLHQIQIAHGRLYAFDAVVGAILVSTDGGRTWSEHITPRELVYDFAVDPADPERIVASTEGQLFLSTDTGDTWRPVGPALTARLAWPEPGTLLRADGDGTFHASADGGRTWEERGTLDGEPYGLEAESPERAHLVLADGAIVGTSDGGRTFDAVFRP